MRKLVYAFAIIAAAASTAAVAGEIKQDKKAAVSMVKATVMSDAEMDKISAGENTLPIPPDPLGRGEDTARYFATAKGGDPLPPVSNGAFAHAGRACVGLGLGTGFGVQNGC